jgi:hypothetical protein
MEIPAWLNDLTWNDMKDNPEERFKPQQLRKCRRIFPNGTVVLPTETDYERIFGAKKRDLPLETYFLGLCALSFFMYLVSSLTYLTWKRILPNINICIAVNFLGTIIHCTAFCFILTSSVMYSEEDRKYMGHPVCYAFKCPECSDDDSDYLERARSLYYNTRHCLERLNICQLNWLKDRIVFLLLGCTLASIIALVSSINRRTRHLRRNKMQPKKTSLDSDSTILIRPSMKGMKEKSSLPDATVINALLPDGPQ